MCRQICGLTDYGQLVELDAIRLGRLAGAVTAAR